MLKRLLFILIIFSVSPGLRGQNLDGIWKGTLTQNAGGCFPVYKVELNITVSGTSVKGNSYHYSDITNYVKKDFTGSYEGRSRTLYLQEHKISIFHIPADCVPCIRYYRLDYYKKDGKEYLAGEWGGVVMNGSAACTPGRIELSRALTSDFANMQEIHVDSGLLKLDFYDNAEIDGDSITVTLNDSVLVTHQKLGTKPVTIMVRVDPSKPEQILSMVAENLGSIPPNTALLVATSGKRKYQLFLKADQQMSARVRIIYDPTPI